MPSTDDLNQDFATFESACFSTFTSTKLATTPLGASARLREMRIDWMHLRKVVEETMKEKGEKLAKLRGEKQRLQDAIKVLVGAK